MMTFDQSPYTLYQKGKIPMEQTLLSADSKTDFKLRIKLSKSGMPLLESEPLAVAEWLAQVGRAS